MNIGRRFFWISIVIGLGLITSGSFAQTPPPIPFPRMAGYLGILHPLITFNQNGSETNFSHYYVVGFPIGLNLWKTEKIGFSVEIVPLIRAQDGTSRVANVLFHPGINTWME